MIKAALLVFLFQFSAFATDASYSTFYSLESIDHRSAPLCPDGVTCIVNGTIVGIDYEVACNEEIVSFAYEAVEMGDDLHIYVNAVAGTNDSGLVSCLSFAKETRDITLINQYGNVVIHDLGVQK